MKTDISTVCKKILNEYGDQATDIVKEETKAVLKDATKEIKSTSPKRTGEYARSWKSQITDTRNGFKAVVYSSNSEYRLTHLLEFGHLSRNGKRVKAIPHIEPVNNKAQEEIVKRIMDKLK